MAHHRFSAHQGHVHRPVFPDQVQDAIDERIAAEIVQLGKELAIAKVRIAVGVPTGTTEGAFARNLDGKHWRFAAKDFSPSAHYLARSNTWIWLSGSHGSWMLGDGSWLH